MRREIPGIRYLWPPVTIAAALGMRLAMGPVLGAAAPYPLFVAAVLCSAVLGGLGPGLVATVLGGLAAAYFIVPPYHSLLMYGADHLIGFATYLAASITVVLLAHAQRRAATIAEARGVELEAEVARRRGAEEMERTHRQRLEVTLASIGDGVVVTDRQARVTMVNGVAAGLTGWRAEDAAGQPVESVFRIENEETGATVENPASRAMAQGRIVGLANHTVLISRDGVRRCIDDSGSPIVDAAGNVVGAVLIFRDVTEARARDADLRARDRIIQFSHDAIIACDPERRITFWNRGAEEMYGWTADEARGRVIHELLETRNSKQMAQIDQTLRNEGRWDGELIHCRKDGTEIVSESRHVFLGDPGGAMSGILEINRDITTRKQAEQELRAAAAEAEEGRRTLLALMRHIPEGVAVAEGNDGVIRIVSRHAAELAGKAEDEVKGIPAAQLSRVWGIVRADGSTPLDGEFPLVRALSAGQVTKNEEWLIKRADGGVVPILCNAGPIRDSAGRIAGGLLAFTDISQRKDIERKLRDTAKLESLGVLAGGVAHDFNNLLTGVLGNASLLLDEVPAGSRAWSFAQGIAKSAERAASLTRQMLAYAGRGQFIIEPVDLSNFIRETIPLIEAAIPKNVDVRLSLAERLPLIDADLGQMQQVIMNLVVNAAEAVGREGGWVSVVTRTQEADETYLRSLGPDHDLRAGFYVALEVEDNGCGMDTDTLSRIFDPFFTTKFTGRGLGLAAVQGIVRAHKGAIRVYSTPGVGTMFRVLLPAAGAGVHPVPDTDAASALQSLRGSGTVLVVDDEEIVRLTAKAALESVGYNVALACDGAEAVETFGRIAPDVALVLLDMTMPGISGEETLRRLRAVRPDVLVVLSTGFGEVEAAHRFADQGLAGFLHKPYNVATLAEKVRTVIAAQAGQ